MNPTENEGEKGFLIFVALAIGCAVFLLLALERIPGTERVDVAGPFSPAVYETRNTTILSLSHRPIPLLVFFGALGVATALIYPVFAAGAIGIFQEMRSWAYCGRCEPVGNSERLILAAVWPLTLLIGGIIYIFVGLVNRLF